MNKWMDVYTNEWMYKKINECLNQWIINVKYIISTSQEYWNKWMIDWTNEWMFKPMNVKYSSLTFILLAIF